MMRINFVSQQFSTGRVIRGLAFIALGLMLAGCGGSRRLARLEREESAFSASPPRFLAGPAGLLLTNTDGFSARITLVVSSNATRTITGTILGRGPHLLYAPEKSDRTFIWDADRNSGYLLSEAMQGYGPIRPTEHVATNFVVNAGEPVAERANGHPCRKTDWIAESSDGSRTRCSVWRADDLKGFPVRIKAVERSSEFTIDFSDVRLAAPSEKLFQPPGDFTAYSSGDSLITELMMREGSAKRKHNDNDADFTTPPRTGTSISPTSGHY